MRRPKIGISGFETGSSPVKPTLFSKLTNWANVELLDPETEHPDLLDHEFDLYHMARRRQASLADLKRASHGGVRTVNPYDGAEMVADRLRCIRLLRSTGFRVPAYQYGRADEITLDPPVIVKPRYEIGPHRHEFSVITEGEIEFEGRRLVQQYVPHERTIKLYRVGDVLEIVDAGESVRQPIQQCAATHELTTIAESVRDITGLNLFEVDLIETERLVVVDVNSVISLRGIRDGCSVYENFLESQFNTPEYQLAEID